MVYTHEFGVIQKSRKKIVTLIVALAFSMLATIGLVLPAIAAEGYSLFGDAEYVSPGNVSPRAVQLRSDADPGYGGVDFSIPAGTTFADLDTLSTDYKFETDDSCGGGSPRFQVNVEDAISGDNGNIFVYIGPAPNYTLCPPDVWTNSGDLLEGVNPIDTGQLDGGTFYDPYATALTKYGGYSVTGVQLVVDAGWFFGDGEQTAFADNTNIDGVVYTYDNPTDKDECKQGGWEDFGFRNQGQCIRYVNTGQDSR